MKISYLPQGRHIAQIRVLKVCHVEHRTEQNMKNPFSTEQEQNKNTENILPKNTEQNRTQKIVCSFIPGSQLNLGLIIFIIFSVIFMANLGEADWQT